MSWKLEPVSPDSEAWTSLGKLFVVKDPSHLGVGRDVLVKEKYSNLTPICAWKVSAPARQAKYNIAKTEVQEQLSIIQKFAGLPVVETQLDGCGLDVDSRLNEKMLLHGTKPDTLLTILQNGLNERFSGGAFGQGIYLAEDAAKADQYCTPHEASNDRFQQLCKSLYIDFKINKPNRVFYAFVCRVILAYPIYSKDGEINLFPPYQQMFATSDRRELAAIPGSSPPIHYHTAIIECGPPGEGFKLNRHREFVIYHSDRIQPEYIIAYTRDTGREQPLPLIIGKPEAEEPPRDLVAPTLSGTSRSQQAQPTKNAWTTPAFELCTQTIKKLDSLRGKPMISHVCTVLSDKLQLIVTLLDTVTTDAWSEVSVDVTAALEHTSATISKSLGRVDKDELWICAQELQTVLGDLSLVCSGSMLTGAFDRSQSKTSSEKEFHIRQHEWLQSRKQQRSEARKRADYDRTQEGFLSKYFPLFNKKYSIRRQLFLGILGCALISMGLFILTGLVTVTVNGKKTKDTVRSSFESHAAQTLLTTSVQMASAIDARFRMVGEGVNMFLAKQMAVLTNSGVSVSNGQPQTLFRPIDSYADFGFHSGCHQGSAPFGCPSDYGSLDTRSRFGPGGKDGSMMHSSVHLFSSASNQPITSSYDWSAHLNGVPSLNASVQATAFIDRDLQTVYLKGPDTILFMYLAMKVPTARGDYFAFRRTYPGINLDVDGVAYGDPTARSWYLNAPLDSFYVQGPYVETVTKKFVLTLSTKQIMHPAYSDNLDYATEAVAASVILLKDVENLIGGMSYLKSGFAVLAKTTGEIIFWGDATANFVTYNEQSGTFMNLTDADPGLTSFSGLFSGENGGSFDYVKQSPGVGSGERWFGASTPFFRAIRTKNGITTESNQMVLLLFARANEVLVTLPELENQVDSCTYTVTLIVVIGSVVLWILVAVSVGLSNIAIGPSLRFLVNKSKEVVNAAAMDLDSSSGRYRDLADGLPNIPPVQRASKRMSELGRLILYFHTMVKRLAAAEQAKLEQPKFPPNPFHGSQEELSAVRFTALASRLKNMGKVTNPFEVEAGRHQQLMEQERKQDELSQKTGCGLGCARCLGTFGSLRAIGGLIAALLFVGLVIILIISTTTLASRSSSWLSESASNLVAGELGYLQRVAQSRSMFMAAFYQRTALDNRILADFSTGLMTLDLTDSTWESNSLLPVMYSLDCTCSSGLGDVNAYECFIGSSCNTLTDYNFSGYYTPTSNQCPSPGCKQDSVQTKFTSLWDLKAKSFFHSRSLLQFVQLGLEDQAFTRIYPYSHKAFGHPTSCLVDADTTNLPSEYAFCSAKSTICQGVNTGGGSYPLYDVRCRLWYQFVVSRNDPHSAGFMPPRRISTGQTVVTASMLLQQSNGTRIGGVSVNALAGEISTYLNSLQILQTGYAYVLDAAISGGVILHPQLVASGCTSQFSSPASLNCVESTFSPSEWQTFSTQVMPFLPLGFLGSFMKGGEEWKVASAPLVSEDLTYTLVATVKTAEVQQIVMKAQSEIDAAVNSQKLGFALILVFCVLFCSFLLFLLVRSVDRAITELMKVCKFIAEGDLSSAEVPLPSTASSSDMRQLLEAFASMLLAFRFGSDSFAAGDLSRARSVFADAIRLFENICNDRGAGVAYNNMGAVNLAQGEWAAGAAHYQISIGIASAHLNQLLASGGSQETAIKFAKKQLSNRIGNYAGLIIEAGIQGQDPVGLVEYAQTLDEEIGSVYGWTVKQSVLATFYKKQNELSSAERCLKIAIERVNISMAQDGRVNPELEVAKELAYYNLAAFFCSKADDPKKPDYITLRSAARELLADCLGEPQVHEPRVTGKAISLFLRITESELEKRALTDLAKSLGIPIGKSSTSAKKRVAFLMDYSGSMSGSKIKAAVAALVLVFEKNIRDDDQVMLAHFNNAYTLDFDLSAKSEGAEDKLNRIRSLVNPGGGTKFFDSIEQATSRLSREASTYPGLTNWIVALTDGDDNQSTMKQDMLKRSLIANKNIIKGLIVIAVGDDVKQAPLKDLVSATEHGAVVFASGSAESIAQAFNQAAEMIESHVVLEDF